jgi:cytochrome b
MTMHRIRVWDLPTRLFHWLLALSVLGLLVSGQIGGNAMNWHLRFGQAVLALLAWRLVWGLVGGHWSRFGQFLYGPGSLLAYLRGQAPLSHSVGHSPLGALSVWAMLLVLSAQVGSGLLTDDEIAFFGPLVPLVGGDWVALATRWHKNIGQWLVLGLVVLHLGALLVHRWRGHPPLVRPMITGDKQVPVPVPASRDDALTRLLALAVLGLCGWGVVWLFGLSAAGAGVY